MQTSHLINNRKFNYFSPTYSLKKSSCRRWFVKKLFLINSQNSQENTNVGVSYLVKLQCGGVKLFKKKFRHRCFPENCAKFQRTPPSLASVNG